MSTYAWLGQTLTDAIEVGNIALYLLAREEQETRVRCPYCQRLFEQDEIEDHIARQHREVLD